MYWWRAKTYNKSADYSSYMLFILWTILARADIADYSQDYQLESVAKPGSVLVLSAITGKIALGNMGQGTVRFKPTDKPDIVTMTINNMPVCRGNGTFVACAPNAKPQEFQFDQNQGHYIIKNKEGTGDNNVDEFKCFETNGAEVDNLECNPDSPNQQWNLVPCNKEVTSNMITVESAEKTTQSGQPGAPTANAGNTGSSQVNIVENGKVTTGNPPAQGSPGIQVGGNVGGASGTTSGAPGTTSGAPGTTPGAPCTTPGAPGTTSGAPGAAAGASSGQTDKGQSEPLIQSYHPDGLPCGPFGYPPATPNGPCQYQIGLKGYGEYVPLPKELLGLNPLLFMSNSHYGAGAPHAGAAPSASPSSGTGTPSTGAAPPASSSSGAGMSFIGAIPPASPSSGAGTPPAAAAPIAAVPIVAAPPAPAPIAAVPIAIPHPGASGKAPCVGKGQSRPCFSHRAPILLGPPTRPQHFNNFVPARSRMPRAVAMLAHPLAGGQTGHGGQAGYSPLDALYQEPCDCERRRLDNVHHAMDALEKQFDSNRQVIDNIPPPAPVENLVEPPSPQDINKLVGAQQQANEYEKCFRNNLVKSMEQTLGGTPPAVKELIESAAPCIEAASQAPSLMKQLNQREQAINAAQQQLNAGPAHMSAAGILGMDQPCSSEYIQTEFGRVKNSNPNCRKKIFLGKQPVSNNFIQCNGENCV